MAYEVTKTINGGQYRYEVESYRDPQTGKVRNKWRYLGKAEGGATPRPRRRAEETREAFMASLERSLEGSAWQDVTVRQIAEGAGLTEATFYRYFKSRNDLLRACGERFSEEIDVRIATLGDVAETLDDERRRLRAWAEGIFGDPHSDAVLFAVWVAGVIAHLREQRFERRRVAFVDYLRQLKNHHYIRMSDPQIEMLAIALAQLVQSFVYRRVIERHALTRDDAVAMAQLMERAIFCA